MTPRYRTPRLRAFALWAQALQAEDNSLGDILQTYVDNWADDINLDGLESALSFLDQCRADKSAVETGAMRDAHEWLESAARLLVRKQKTPPRALEATAPGGGAG
jgi:hypothetical protein